MNIKELAKSLDLSISTVSRVLNGKAEAYRISEATQKKVKKAAAEFNYVPNKLARSLKLDKTDIIGLIIPDIGNPYFAEIAKNIESQSKQNGYSIILCDSADDISTEEEMISLLLSQKVDGIIIAPVGTEKNHLIRLYNSKLPLVIIDRIFPNDELPYITSDNYQGAFDAVNFLILHGHKDIACIQGINNSQPNIERVKGYIDALKTNDIKFKKNFLVGNSFSKENGYKEAVKLFSKKNPPTAIFALSNLIALGILGAASDCNLEIPQDFSLIAFDEQPYSEYLRTPMTTINQQKDVMGQQAVDYIIASIESKEKQPPISLRLKTNLIPRKSVKKID
jgi:LacI family transcriptional regulator